MTEEFALLAERGRLARLAQADLNARHRSIVFRARVWLASAVLGRRNWRIIYRHAIAVAATDPRQVDRLLGDVFARTTKTSMKGQPE